MNGYAPLYLGDVLGVVSSRCLYFLAGLAAKQQVGIGALHHDLATYLAEVHSTDHLLVPAVENQLCKPITHVHRMETV